MSSEPILPTERFYRARLFQEQLEHMQSMLAVTALSLHSVKDADELTALQHASRHLLFAADALKDAEREASVSIAPDLIEEQLRASLELISRSPERMRSLLPCSRCGYIDCVCTLQEE